MKLKRKMKISVLTIVLLLLISLPVHAALFGFTNITNNNPDDAAIGEAQLFVDVTDPGESRVLFWFTNIGLDSCSIADVYFDDGTLLEIASLIDADNGVGGHPDVDFTQFANPKDLPGGENITPHFDTTTTGFSADSDSPPVHNGVNPGEYLGILFNLQSGNIFSDVLANLGTGNLRIGIHVQGFESGGSESFINAVPTPSTVFLLGSGLIGLVALRRKSIS